MQRYASRNQLIQNRVTDDDDLRDAAMKTEQLCFCHTRHIQHHGDAGEWLAHGQRTIRPPAFSEGDDLVRAPTCTAADRHCGGVDGMVEFDNFSALPHGPTRDTHGGKQRSSRLFLPG
jgi:hypothetical protein